MVASKSGQMCLVVKYVVNNNNNSNDNNKQTFQRRTINEKRHKGARSDYSPKQ